MLQWTFRFFFFYSLKVRFDISCELSMIMIKKIHVVCFKVKTLSLNLSTFWTNSANDNFFLVFHENRILCFNHVNRLHSIYTNWQTLITAFDIS